MDSQNALLATLQLADSFFPGGSMAFSSGLETLRAEGQLASATDLRRFMGGQIRHRWATCDRPALVAAYRAAQVVDALPEIDHLLEALTLAVELREGSRRAGAALLAVHDKLGTAGAGEYRRRVRRRETPGNLVVVQGLVFRGVGLPEASAEAAAAHLFCAGLLGAALRLGLIGHVAAQRILSDLRAEIGDLLRQPAAPLASLGAFAPVAEIAVMRHEIQPIRLFAN